MNSYRKDFLEVFNAIDFHKIKDHPNILIAANFWDDDRFCAAKVCYKFMRNIDDLIDNHKANNRAIAPSERKDFLADVNKWLNMIIISEECNPDNVELIKTIERFRIPVWPLEAFAKSMIYDINNDGFPSLQSFIDYAQGASVAPASIFVHLAGLKSENGYYLEPEFDVKHSATQCAIFSYLVHIIRDFQKDQFNNLNYFADDLIIKHGLSRQMMYDIAHGSQVTEGFRKLIKEYYDLAGVYSEKTKEVIKVIRPFLAPKYQLSLDIIYNLYLMVYERINIETGNFTSFELNPTPVETKERVREVIMTFEPSNGGGSLV